MIYGIIGIVALVVLIKLFKWPFKILLNGIFGIFLLYIVNFLGAGFGIHIGINIVTALIAGILGIPGVAALILLSLLF
ncbi:MAG: pro-sigmaK processing inhibitor BofA family protein [Clostridium sp.]|uniref:pro-sigmaK processing inhibitor BofA family protein n=1 Tax=Clostridium sp. DSM 8431 TaxID=1761781 RepID=UPI001587174B|nr:pro-sigmaK processing inhibitor BofA family protein [Clostridium sp. DSM 8431]MCR4943257.1 pro-sigmaK processing inhibitor BofA family protein [Clostridium sp.]